jgi:hypothetical protein
MELDNTHIILLDHLYNFELNTNESILSYWKIKNDIYHKFLFSEKQLEKNELESLENEIYNHYKQYKKFNFNAVFDSKDPIKYITYLSHSKKKLLVNTNLLT